MSEAEKPKMKTRKNSAFHENIKDKDTATVLFYATWCPYSQEFLPIFEEYSKSNPKECLSLIADEEPDVFEEYAIEYYPTVIMFRKGKVHKRLNSEPHVGLNKKQLREFTEKK
ncbi:MAG TPA: thioredoxin family protein [Candidatus Acidoferrum sp.]|nr:thioredoxin family protein [Candidatus Acidoferrum sp.]